MSWRSLSAVLAVVLAMCAGPAQASSDGYVLAREGFWRVGRGSADSQACLASVPTQAKSFLMITASGAKVGLAVLTERPQRQGRKGVLETDTHAFEFVPQYDDEGDVLIVQDEISERLLAALRLADTIKVKVDGRAIIDVTLENSGFESALDAVLACGKGAAGWWGAGVDQALLDDDEPPGVLNPEGYWRLSADDEDGRCAAIASLAGGGAFVLNAGDGNISFGAVSSGSVRPGRKGKFETDAWSFDFEPSYDEGYLYLDDVLNNRALAALRLASRLRISVDGRKVVDMELKGTGLDGVLDALIDCASGKPGWWGDGATSADSPAPPARPGVNSGSGKERSARAGSGSAFFITPDGFAVTAAHVVQQCREIESPRWGRARLVAIDRPADLAILKLDSGNGQSLALRGRGPRLGEPLSVGGFPLGGLLGDGLRITTGVVAGLSGPQGDRGLFQISASIQPGNSGGPVIDGAGGVIGVTAAKLDEVRLVSETGAFPQNVNFAAPVTILQAFLDENGVAYRVAPTSGPATPVNLASVTFSIVCKP